MIDSDHRGTTHLNRKDLFRVLGVAAASAAFGGSALSQPAKIEGGGESPWQPNWVGENNWPDGLEGQLHNVELKVEAGQVLALSNGSTVISDDKGLIYIFEPSERERVAQEKMVIIPIVDGGSKGGTVNMTVISISNWKGYADKPESGKPLTTEQWDIVILNRIEEARRFGATRATVIQMVADQIHQFTNATKIIDLSTYIERLKSRLQPTCFQVFVPKIEK